MTSALIEPPGTTADTFLGLVRCDVTAVDDLDVTPIEEISAEVPVEVVSGIGYKRFVG